MTFVFSYIIFALLFTIKHLNTMKTVEIYSYSELSEEAKVKAYQNWLNEDREFFYGDYMETIHKGLGHFGFNLINWSFEYWNASRAYIKITSSHDEEIEELSGHDLANYLVTHFSDIWNKYRKKYVNLFNDGDCLLTGMCYDEGFLQPIKDFLKEPYNITFFELMELAVKAAFKELQNDYEYCESKEYFEQKAESNEYQYFENGREY